MKNKTFTMQYFSFLLEMGSRTFDEIYCSSVYFTTLSFVPSDFDE